MVVSLQHVTKAYRTGHNLSYVARDLDFTFPAGQAMALLGRNGAGKSSLLRMVAGTMRPDQGRIYRNGSVSWPVGFQGSFHPDLTGVENARFAARIYGVDSDEITDFVADFAELGKFFQAPVRQ